MDVFDLRATLVAQYERFARSFTTIRAADIREQVEAHYRSGRFWPDPLVQLNPRFEGVETVDELVASGVLKDRDSDHRVNMGRPDAYGQAGRILSSLHNFTGWTLHFRLRHFKR